MKRILSILAVCLVAASCASTRNAVKTNPDIEAIKAAGWNWQKVGNSNVEATWASVKVFGSTQSISLVRFPIKKQELSVVDAGGPAAAATSSLAEAVEALAAINGSYFDMETLWPTTLIKDEGNVVCASTRPSELKRCNGLIRIDGSKVDILSLDTLSYGKEIARWREAMVAGPVLLEEGRVIKYASKGSNEVADSYVNPKYFKKFYSKRHPRTLAGYTRSGWVYFIVVDGRFPGQADGMSIAELQTLSVALGLYESINLDGGGSSTLWVKTDGVLNHPYDNKTFDHAGERAVPNVLIVK